MKEITIELLTTLSKQGVGGEILILIIILTILAFFVNLFLLPFRIGSIRDNVSEIKKILEGSTRKEPD